MSNDCIVLVTKDRPAKLLKTIQHLNVSEMNVIILDDSTSQITKDMVLAQTFKNKRLIYHGTNEQNKLLKKLKPLNLNTFLKPLGSRGWNLGFARNYALILSKALRCDKLLFMDDDIIIQDMTIKKTMLMKLDYCDFVGAKLIGMPDDSVTGHLMRACGGQYYEFLSGGFLAINVHAVTEYFFNCYNEDQIWFFLHHPSTKFERFGEVEHQQYNPFRNASATALSQEFGEILDDGAEEAFNRRDSNLLISPDFWEEMCNIRINYLNQLPELSIGKEIEYTAQNVYKALMNYHSKISYNTFVDLFLRYFKHREKWRDALNSLEACHLEYLEAKLCQI
ncbi:MAG: glycosyltransferase [candidate division Zixibacteria bacterium]|nr:glycosyltransferase [candidate division Zixibacteria bacterium]